MRLKLGASMERIANGLRLNESERFMNATRTTMNWKPCKTLSTVQVLRTNWKSRTRHSWEGARSKDSSTGTSGHLMPPITSSSLPSPHSASPPLFLPFSSPCSLLCSFLTDSCAFMSVFWEMFKCSLTKKFRFLNSVLYSEPLAFRSMNAVLRKLVESLLFCFHYLFFLYFCA